MAGLSRHDITQLLEELARRLDAADVAARIYVVGEPRSRSTGTPAGPRMTSMPFFTRARPCAPSRPIWRSSTASLTTG